MMFLYQRYVELVVLVICVVILNGIFLWSSHSSLDNPDSFCTRSNRLLDQLENKHQYNQIHSDGKLRVLNVMGTQPEAIKMAPIIRKLNNQSMVQNYVCNTGQHQEIIRPLMNTFNIHPDFDLDMMVPGSSLSDMAAVLTVLLDKVMSIVEPHVVIVQGDTTTAMTAGMAAFYRRIPVAHVEAGLRTRSLYSPFPEEENRRILGTLCSLCYAPTSQAAANLIAEGVPSSTVRVTGNTAIDNLLWMTSQINHRESLIADGSVVNKDPVVLVTAHRRENWGQPMDRIVAAVKTIALQRPNVKIIFPLHPNPIIRDSAISQLSEIRNVELLESLEYSEMVQVMSKSTLILTDSGGIQEEASGLSIPVLVLRDNTERMEGIRENISKLVGTQTETIVTETLRLLDDPNHYQTMSRQSFPYGRGDAASIIVKDIMGHKNSLMRFSSSQNKSNHFNRIDESNWKNPEELMDPKYKRELTQGTVSVILTLYKRNHLEEQIQALKSQSLSPTQIYVFQNEHNVDVRDIINRESNVHLIQSVDMNFKYHGRFAVPLLLDTEYVAIFDDDVIPGSRWLEHALQVSQERNALIGGNGRIIKETGVKNRGKWQISVNAGSPSIHHQDKQVDFVGHCWFFKREWIHLFWREPPISWQSGEDISLSALLQIHGNIPSYVPRMPPNDKTLWSDLKTGYGRDSVSSWKHTPNTIREQIALYYINRGWQTVKFVKTEK